MKSAPNRTSAWPPHPSRIDAENTSSVPSATRRPMCSRNTAAATIVVNTSSKLRSSDDVAPDRSARPTASSTGPIAPPNTTASASRLRPRRSAAAVGRALPSIGRTAIAAPRYSSPASVNADRSSVSRAAAGAEMPNSTAASAQRITPSRLMPAGSSQSSRADRGGHGLLRRWRCRSIAKRLRWRADRESVR